MENKQSSLEKLIDRNMRKVRHSQRIAAYLAVYDVFAVTIAYFVALWLRFDLKYTAIRGPRPG